MVHVLEHTPRLELRQLRGLATWPEMKAAGTAALDLVGPAGEVVTVTVELTEDYTSLGVRTWFKCPSCGSRRRHLYWLDQQLQCRACHRTIRYFIHTLPAGQWKRKVAVPVLKTGAVACSPGAAEDQ